MTPQEQIRKLADGMTSLVVKREEKAWSDVAGIVEAAIREGVKLALAEPNLEMLVAGRIWSDKKYGKPVGNDGIIGCWHCLAAIRLRELGVEE